VAGKYKNPFRDLVTSAAAQLDNDMRNTQQEEDGIVAEVIFPNTVPPFSRASSSSHHRRQRTRTNTDWPASGPTNRCWVDWCNEYPERRAGIGQIFLNDVDDALPTYGGSRSTGCAAVSSSRTSRRTSHGSGHSTIRATNHCGRCCEELGVPVHSHGGIGCPDYGPYPVSMLLYMSEVGFYSQRPFVHLLCRGLRTHPASNSS